MPRRLTFGWVKPIAPPAKPMAKGVWRRSAEWFMLQRPGHTVLRESGHRLQFGP